MIWMVCHVERYVVFAFCILLLLLLLLLFAAVTRTTRTMTNVVAHTGGQLVTSQKGRVTLMRLVWKLLDVGMGWLSGQSICSKGSYMAMLIFSKLKEWFPGRYALLIWDVQCIFSYLSWGLYCYSLCCLSLLFLLLTKVEFFWEDIVCKYWKWANKISTEVQDSGMKPALSVMHAKGHSWSCQVSR